MAGLADFLKSLSVLLSLPALGIMLYWVLQKKLEAILARRLEITKHELQLEYQKMSVVFEHQKDSFRNVLVAMHHAVEAIASGAEDRWYPISRDQLDTFRRVVSEESLFMDTESDHALRIFVAAMRGAVEEPFDAGPDQEDIWRAHTQTTFISERLSDHFRCRVGLTPTRLNSLVDVELLGACRLINRHHNFQKHNLPAKGPLAFRPGQTASEWVAAAKQNPEILRIELEQLKKTNLSFQDGREVDHYLKTLGGFTAETQQQ